MPLIGVPRKTAETAATRQTSESTTANRRGNRHAPRRGNDAMYRKHCPAQLTHGTSSRRRTTATSSAADKTKSRSSSIGRLEPATRQREDAKHAEIIHVNRQSREPNNERERGDGQTTTKEGSREQCRANIGTDQHGVPEAVAGARTDDRMRSNVPTAAISATGGRTPKKTRWSRTARRAKKAGPTTDASDRFHSVCPGTHATTRGDREHGRPGNHEQSDARPRADARGRSTPKRHLDERADQDSTGDHRAPSRRTADGNDST